MILNPAQRPAWSRYVIAVLAVVLAAAVRAGLLGTLGTRAPFVTFYPAVIVAAMFGGLPGGLLATALSALTVAFAWMEPVGQFSIRDTADWLSQGVFVMSGAAISLVTQAMQRAQARAGEAEAQITLATERSRAAEELHRHKLLAEHSRDIILYLRRADGRILEANAAAAAAYGYTRDELQSLSIRVLRAPDAPGSLEDLMAEADTVGATFETVHRRKDGSTFPVEVRSQGATIAGTRTLISVIRDITERHRADETLRESEAVLRSFFDSAGMMRGIVDMIDGRIVHVSCNAFAAEVFGVDLVSIARKSATDAGAAEEMTQWWGALCEESRRTGKPVSKESARRGADGQERWLLATASYLGTSGSENPRFAYTALDITDRKRADEAVRKREARLSTALDHLGEGVIMATEAGEIFYWNPAARAMFGFASEEEGRGPLKEVPKTFQLRTPDSGRLLPLEEWPMSRILRGETVRNLELRLRRPDRGWERIVSYSGAMLETAGGERLACLSVYDLTEQRRAEEQLRHQREWLRVTLTSIGDAVLATGNDGRITFLNPVAAGLTGWSEEEALGQPIQDVFRIINEQSREPAEDIAGRVLREGLVASLANHVALVTRDGREVPIEDSAAPIRNAGGGVDGVVVVFHEVTQKRRAQEALRAERERLRVALDASNSGIWEWDLRTNENFWSEEMWKIYGLEPHSCTPSYEAWRQIVIPEDRPGAEQAVQEAARNGAELNVEFRVRRRDGAERWLMAIAQPLRDADGQTTRYVGIAVDITDRRRAEEALRERESQLRTLGDNLPEGAIYRYRHDANGEPHVDFISAGIERLTGVPAAEFMSDAATVERSILPEDVDRLQAAIRLSRKRLSRFEVEVRHKHRATGETRWSLLRSTPSRCPDGSTVWDGIELDITERKRTEEALRASEEALRESEARYRRLVDLAPEALLVLQDGQIVYCNEAAARLYGAENTAKLLGTGAFDRVHPDDLPSVMERIRDAERGVRLPVREARHLRLDGSEVAVETTAGPVEWHGRLAMQVFVRDITDRKRAEARLRDAQKLESLGLLAGGVAHDFNNLLVGVVGNASLAREMLPPDHPVAELLTSVLKTGEQAAHLTRQMLAYSGKGRFVVEPLDLSALLPEMSVLLRPSISKKIALRLDLEHDLPAIEADRGQVQQVFMNLALNAAEAIGSHEGLVTVRTFVRDLDEGYQRTHPETVALTPGEYVCLEVCDTGCGMDEATKDKIFDPFFSTKFVGRGLGLAAVAGIVRGHKGAIAVTSAPGHGSCFTVVFPAAARAAREAPLVVRNTALQGTGTVLVVDDERMVREMVKRALERHGYTVLLADSGLAAIDVLRRHPGEIALVLLDLSMPHMNGEEALPELRKIRPEVKVVVSSGYSESEAMALFKGQRVAGFIQKPYTSEGIASKVKACAG